MPRNALVFISHDSRDADLAQEFANLLSDASGGMLKSFRSSDAMGNGGIPYGAAWYNVIMSKLNDATDVVALLTPNSIDRPWILYEAGVAKGKIIALVIGLSLERALRGPFSLFHNCGDDQGALTKLVTQLIKQRIPGAGPRAETVKRQVRAFRDKIADLLKKQRADNPRSAEKLREVVDRTKRELDLAVAKYEALSRLFTQTMETLVIGRAPRTERFKRVV